MKSTKKSLVASGLSLLTCAALLAGTTFAWFTDSVTNKGNKIEAGTLNVSLAEWDGTAGGYVEVGEDPIFNYDLWEPGYTDIAAVKIGNEGTLALKYELDIIANGASELAEVIDVYYYQGGNAANGLPTDFEALKADDNYKKLDGTLADLLADEDNNGVAHGHIEAGEADFAIIALHMQETAGNEYQGKSIGTTFDIVLNATQYNSENEKDGFGNPDYDKDAPGIKFDATADGADFAAAVAALNDGETLEVSGDVELTEAITIDKDVTIKGDGTNTISNKSNDDKDLFVISGSGLRVTFADIKLDNAPDEEKPNDKGNVINATTVSDSTLVLNNVTIQHYAFNGNVSGGSSDGDKNCMGVAMGMDSHGSVNNHLVINNSTISSNYKTAGTDSSYAPAVRFGGSNGTLSINGSTIDEGQIGIFFATGENNSVSIRDTKITAEQPLDVRNMNNSTIDVSGGALTARAYYNWGYDTVSGAMVIKGKGNTINVKNTNLANQCKTSNAILVPIVSYGTGAANNVVNLDQTSFNTFKNSECSHTEDEFITNLEDNTSKVFVAGTEQTVVKVTPINY